MSRIADSPDILAAIRQRKEATKLKLDASRTQIMATANQFWSPPPQAAGRTQSVSRLISNGVFIYNTIRVIARIYSGVHSLFGRDRRR